MTGIDIGLLPRRTLDAGTKLYRIHRAVHGPWYFDCSGDGRYDPVGSSGCGSCYWAEVPTGAWIEVFRSVMLLAESDVAARRLSVITLDDPLEVADLTVAKALRAGVTSSLTSGASYDESHELAASLQGQVDGIRWRVRHDLSARRLGIAIFGPEGAPSAAELARLPRPETKEIPPRVISTACRIFGYRVLPDPT